VAGEGLGYLHLPLRHFVGRQLRSPERNADGANGVGEAPQSGSILINAEPIGSIRLPNINLVDFRLEKSFSVFNHHKIAGRLNVYNLMNANTVTAEIVQSGATFGQPAVSGMTAATLLPRIFELSASYSF
jgi:hypothetical protein